MGICVVGFSLIAPYRPFSDYQYFGEIFYSCHKSERTFFQINGNTNFLPTIFLYHVVNKTTSHFVVYLVTASVSCYVQSTVESLVNEELQMM